MAVIISDMEHIPNGCFDCDLHNYHFCNLTGNLVENNLDDGTRAGDCPLKEVPSGKWIRQMKSEIADSLEFWDYSPNNNPLARDILETVNTYCAKMFEPQESEET